MFCTTRIFFLVTGLLISGLVSSQKWEMLDKHYRDSISKTKYKNYHDYFILTLKSSTTEREFDLIKNNIPYDTNGFRGKEAHYFISGVTWNLDVSYWKINFGWSKMSPSWIISYDGNFKGQRNGFRAGLPIKNWYLMPALEIERSEVIDSIGIVSRSLKFETIHLPARYRLFTTGYIDQFYSSSYIQTKSAFSINGKIRPFVQRFRTVNPGDSILKAIHQPYWGEMVSLNQIDQYGLEAMLGFSFTWVKKRFYIGVNAEFGAIIQHYDLYSLDGTERSDWGRVRNPFLLEGGFGWNWDRFFLKIGGRLSYNYYSITDFYIMDSYSYGQFGLGFRFKAPEKLNQLRARWFH